jgi:hypothetical protein
MLDGQRTNDALKGLDSHAKVVEAMNGSKIAF